MACKEKRKAACLEEQLFRLGLIVPVIAVPLYFLYVEGFLWRHGIIPLCFMGYVFIVFL